jgi:hypothetical protein
VYRVYLDDAGFIESMSVEQIPHRD